MAVETARKITQLRRALNLRKTDLAKRSGVLSLAQVSHLESGRNSATTIRTRGALARAFGLTLGRFSDYIDGRVGLKDVFEEVAEVPERFDDLEAVLRVFRHDGRWSSATVAAARASYPTAELDPKGWQVVLDAYERALAGASCELPIVLRIAAPSELGVGAAESKTRRRSAAQRSPRSRGGAGTKMSGE
jgi:transcriptional regulator with XRE-family HTH domain